MSTKRILSCFLIANVFNFVYQHAAFASYQLGDWELSPSAGVQEEYDSNITYAHSDKLADFITGLKVGLEGQYTGKNQQADFKTWLDEDIYSKYSQFDNLSEYFTGDYTNDLSYYDHLKVDDSFEHADSPTNFSQEFGRLGGRYQYYNNDFSGVWSHDFNDQWTTKASFANNYYDPLEAGIFSSTQFNPGLEVDYAINSQVSLLGFYEFSDRDFSSQGQLIKNTVGAGATYYWTPKFYLIGKVGADFISPIVGGEETEPNINVSLNDQSDASTLFTLSYIKEYQDTPYSIYLFNNWQVNLQVTRDITARTSVYANVFTGDGTFQEEDLKEKFNGVGGGVVYHVTHNIDLQIDGRYSDNKSNQTVDTYDRFTVLASIKIKF